MYNNKEKYKMSSETINSTTAPTSASQETVFTIDGKDYKKSDLNPKTFNSIVVRQDLQATKVKLSLELEKVAILQAHYDNAIAKELGIEIKKDEPNSSSTGAEADKK